MSSRSNSSMSGSSRSDSESDSDDSGRRSPVVSPPVPARMGNKLKQWGGQGVSETQRKICEDSGLDSLLNLARMPLVKAQALAMEVIDSLREGDNGEISVTSSEDFLPLVELAKFDEEEVQREAVWSLAIMASNSACQRGIEQQVGWPNFQKYASSRIPEIQAGTAILLGNLALEPANQENIIKKGVPILMGMLRDTKDSKVRRAVVTALSNVSIIEGFGATQIWLSHGIELVMPFIEQEDDPQLQIGALNTIANLCNHDAASGLKAKVAKLGGIGRLVPLLDSKDEMIVKLTAMTVANMASDDEHKQIMHELNIEEPLIRLLDSRDEEVQLGVAMAINVLADSQVLVLEFRKRQAIEPLKELIQLTKDRDILKEAREALIKISPGDVPKGSNRIRSDSASASASSSYYSSEEESGTRSRTHSRTHSMASIRSGGKRSRTNSAVSLTSRSSRSQSESESESDSESEKSESKEGSVRGSGFMKDQERLHREEQQRKQKMDTIRPGAFEKQQEEEDNTREIDEVASLKNRLSGGEDVKNLEIERKRREEEDRKRQQEEAETLRLKRDEDARRRQEEEARKRQEDDAKRRQEEEARRKRQEDDNKRHEEEMRRKREEDERKRREDADRAALEERRSKEIAEPDVAAASAQKRDMDQDVSITEAGGAQARSRSRSSSRDSRGSRDSRDSRDSRSSRSSRSSRDSRRRRDDQDRGIRDSASMSSRSTSRSSVRGPQSEPPVRAAVRGSLPINGKTPTERRDSIDSLDDQDEPLDPNDPAIALVNILLDPSHVPPEKAITREALQELERFAERRPRERMAFGSDIISILVYMSYFYPDVEYPDILALVLYLLAILARNNVRNQLAIRRARGDGQIIRLLASIKEPVQRNAALALGAYALNNTPLQNETSKSIPVLIKLLEGAQTPQPTRRAVAACLAALSDNHKPNQNMVVAAGGLKTAVVLLTAEQTFTQNALQLVAALCSRNPAVQDNVTVNHPAFMGNVIGILTNSISTYLHQVNASNCLVEMSKKNPVVQRNLESHVGKLVPMLGGNANDQVILNVLYLLYSVVRASKNSKSVRSELNRMKILDSLAQLKTSKNRDIVDEAEGFSRFLSK